MLEFIKITWRSTKDIDWKLFSVSTIFGYALSMIPLLAMCYSDFPNDSRVGLNELLIEAEPYLVFSIIAFTSVGSILNNSKNIDIPVVCIIGANILVGIIMFYMFSRLSGRTPADQESVKMVLEIGYWAWPFSFFLFAASHLKQKAG